MTTDYSVTFEFPTRPPLTQRGTVTAGSAAMCVKKATRLAQAALRPVAWSSMVCVLLARRADSPVEAGSPPKQGDSGEEVSETVAETPTRAAALLGALERPE
jgi:hypothetical protein